jgi:anaerobic magnesium-protoporphyrin IX monomethyl ester cyclase
MMSKDNYHRYPDDEKVKGVNYQFYRELLAGRYDDEINRGLETVVHGADLYEGTLVKA